MLMAKQSNGFRAIQMAQMELKAMTVDENPRRRWKVFRVIKESRGKLNLDMDAAAFQDSMEKFLAQSFDCVSLQLLNQDSLSLTRHDSISTLCTTKSQIYTGCVYMSCLI